MDLGAEPSTSTKIRCLISESYINFVDSYMGVTQLSTCAKGLDFTRLRYCRLKALRPEASFKKTKRKRQLC